MESIFMTKVVNRYGIVDGKINKNNKTTAKSFDLTQSPRWVTHQTSVSLYISEKRLKQRIVTAALKHQYNFEAVAAGPTKPVRSPAFAHTGSKNGRVFLRNPTETRRTRHVLV
jgi:hypothetical protein